MSRYALTWSGGKDSALALWRARHRGLQVDWLVNVYDRATERVRRSAKRGAKSVMVWRMSTNRGGRYGRGCDWS
jgi:diphthamide synthase (EF-2-diphthine--ammonia ligase)